MMCKQILLVISSVCREGQKEKAKKLSPRYAYKLHILLVDTLVSYKGGGRL